MSHFSLLCVSRWSFSCLFLTVKSCLACVLAIGWCMFFLARLLKSANPLTELWAVLSLRKFRICPASHWNRGAIFTSGSCPGVICSYSFNLICTSKNWSEFIEIWSILVVSIGVKMMILSLTKTYLFWGNTSKAEGRPLAKVVFKKRPGEQQRAGSSLAVLAWIKLGPQLPSVLRQSSSMLGCRALYKLPNHIAKAA